MYINVMLSLLLLLHLMVNAQVAIKKVAVDGHGPTILLLPGGTSDLSAYLPHAKLLSGKYRVIRMEQYNVQFADEGKTLPANYSVSLESRGVKATLDSLHELDRVILVGHSYGAVVALDFALNYPQRVRSLVLDEPPLFKLLLEKEHPAGMDRMISITNELKPNATITEDLLKRFRCELMNCDSLPVQQMPQWPMWLGQKDRLRGLSAVSDYRINLKQLQHFKKPVLIITGRNTVIFHKQIDELLLKTFPFSHSSALPGNHMSIYQQPALFVELLTKFLQQEHL
jgi:pimeloyl-ACP methyl ester carboxylesterase